METSSTFTQADAQTWESEQQRARFSETLREAEIEERYHPESASIAQVKTHLSEIFEAMDTTL